MPKKLVDTNTACRAWLADNSARVGIAANALVYADAAISCCAAVADASELA